MSYELYDDKIWPQWPEVNRNPVPIVKHIGCIIMLWSYFAASGISALRKVDGTIKNLTILQPNLEPSARHLELENNWVLQQHSDLKHTKKKLESRLTLHQPIETNSHFNFIKNTTSGQKFVDT